MSPPPNRRGVLVFGAGNHGRVVVDLLRSQGEHVLGWLDSDEALRGTERAGLPVLGGLSYLEEARDRGAGAIVAIGLNSARMAIAAAIEQVGVPLVNAVHASVVIMPRARIGHGSSLCPGAIVGSGAVLGNNVILNTGASIDHDSVVEDGAWIAPAAATGGAVTIGRGAYVSIGAVLVAGVSVGEGAVIGAGAVVTGHVPAGVLAMGAPARVVRRIDDTFDFRRLVAGLSDGASGRPLAAAGRSPRGGLPPPRGEG